MLRVWSCTGEPKVLPSSVGPAAVYGLARSALIDLLAILPFYVGLFPSLHKLDLRLLASGAAPGAAGAAGQVHSSGLRTLSRVVYAKRVGAAHGAAGPCLYCCSSRRH